MSDYQYWYCKEVKCMSHVDAATGMLPEIMSAGEQKK